MVILENDVGSAVNHKCVVQENLFEDADRQNHLKSEAVLAQWSCYSNRLSDIALPVHSCFLFVLSLIHLIFTN